MGSFVEVIYLYIESMKMAVVLKFSLSCSQAAITNETLDRRICNLILKQFINIPTDYVGNIIHKPALQNSAVISG
jgi:hypothetical protein